MAILVMVGLAPSAFADHANLSACASRPPSPVANRLDVNDSICSWSTGAQGANPDLRVEYRLNGGTWTTGASLAFPVRTAAQGTSPPARHLHRQRRHHRDRHPLDQEHGVRRLGERRHDSQSVRARSDSRNGGGTPLFAR